MTQTQALILSLLLEVPVVLGICRWRDWGEWRTVGLVALAATLITHPFAWWGSQAIYPVLPFPWGWLAVEAAVTAFEGVLYAWAADLGWRKGMGVSLLANAWSAGVGLVLFFWVL